MSSETTAPSGAEAADDFDFDRLGDAAVLTLHPELNDVKWDRIETIGTIGEKRLENEEPKKVVFDLTPLNYVGSAMVALVVRWWKKVDQYDGKSVVACSDQNVLEVLRLAGLDNVWTIVEDRSAAFQKLGVRGRPAGGSSANSSSSSSGEVASGGGGSDGGATWPLMIASVGETIGVLGTAAYFTKSAEPTMSLGMMIVGGLIAVIGGGIGAGLCGGGKKVVSMFLAAVGLVLLTLGLVFQMGDAAGATAGGEAQGEEGAGESGEGAAEQAAESEEADAGAAEGEGASTRPARPSTNLADTRTRDQSAVEASRKMQSSSGSSRLQRFDPRC